jgi:hypothetical protein
MKFMNRNFEYCVFRNFWHFYCCTLKRCYHPPLPLPLPRNPPRFTRLLSKWPPKLPPNDRGAMGAPPPSIHSRYIIFISLNSVMTNFLAFSKAGSSVAARYTLQKRPVNNKAIDNHLGLKIKMQEGPKKSNRYL